MGTQAKFSQCEREFVSKHKRARDCEPVIQFIRHKLPKLHYKLAFEFFEGIFRHLALVTGRKVPPLAPFLDKSAI